jgi:uncharacterized membrane protein YbaN (DUF454 family)
MTLSRSSLSTVGQSLWVAAGTLAIGVGTVGAALPVLPTTPFVILGAFCFARGSPRLALALERHSVFGPMIGDWRAHRIIAPRYKVVAHLMMGAALLMSLLAGVSATVLTIQTICLAFASAYILTRPSGGEPPQEPDRDAVPARPLRPKGA